MLLQAISLISGLLFVAGILLEVNFTVAKNITTSKQAFALQLASSRSLNDAETWARDTLSLNESEGQPTTLQVGAGSSQFGCVDTACKWQFIDQWRVTGATDGMNLKEPQSDAANLEPALKEGRLSMTVTTSLYRSISDKQQAVASRSLLVTARYLNQQPFYVVTAVKQAASNTSESKGSEGDTAGAERVFGDRDFAVPVVSKPADYTNTTLESQITCVNSRVVQNSSNPLLDVPNVDDRPNIPQHAYVPSDETLVWIYEAPCIPPQNIVGIPAGVDVTSNEQYFHIGSSSLNWSKGDTPMSTSSQ